MREVRVVCEKLASAAAPVLICGEDGTGKEGLARQLHRMSPWSQAMLLRLDCAFFQCSLGEPDPLSRAIRERIPLRSPFPEGPDLNRRTSLLLDGVAMLDPVLQIALLDRLREDSLVQFTLSEGCRLELRLICTTDESLERDSARRRLLRELYQLIGVFRLELPPLRLRREDILPIADYLLELFSGRFEVRRPPVPRQVVEGMMKYEWPGNLRQLENLMLRYVVQGTTDVFLREFEKRPSFVASRVSLPIQVAGKK